MLYARKLIVDGDHETTYAEFLADNSAEDVGQLDREDIEKLDNLLPGEECYIQTTLVKCTGLELEKNTLSTWFCNEVNKRFAFEVKQICEMLNNWNCDHFEYWAADRIGLGMPGLSTTEHLWYIERLFAELRRKGYSLFFGPVEGSLTVHPVLKVHRQAQPNERKGAAGVDRYRVVERVIDLGPMTWEQAYGTGLVAILLEIRKDWRETPEGEKS